MTLQYLVTVSAELDATATKLLYDEIRKVTEDYLRDTSKAVHERMGFNRATVIVEDVQPDSGAGFKFPKFPEFPEFPKFPDFPSFTDYTHKRKRNHGRRVARRRYLGWFRIKPEQLVIWFACSLLGCVIAGLFLRLI